MKTAKGLLRCAPAALLLAAPAAAQLGNAWVTFSQKPSHLALPALALTDVDTQVTFRSGDLDQDGWDDVVAVRKQQADKPGKRAAFLLQNLGGLLADRTLAAASASDVPGDSGFLTPCANHDTALADVNNDGWLDVVTAVSVSDGDPKAISHPRVYVNLGEGAFGNWLGLRFENSRFPQLMTVGGLAVAPRFTAVGAGDVTGDGAPDLFFVDHDTTETSGITEPTAWDLNCRLIVNDGNGFFADGSAAMTTAQLGSMYGTEAQIADVNADGLGDVISTVVAISAFDVRFIYNDPADVGNFTAMGFQDVGTATHYGADVGNLNNDGIVDIAILDDGQDKFRLGAGFDAQNRVIWGPLKAFTFVNGGDDGLGHQVHLRDLDGNGWNDVLIADVDVAIPGCNRRLHIYHNTGSVPGDMNIVLKEEVELASGNQGAGWKGAAGLLVADIKGTSDVCCADFDNDGDLDMLVGTCTGTRFFRNETSPTPVVCQTDVGFGGPGSMELSLCGEALTDGGNVATLQLTGGAASTPLFLAAGLDIGPVPAKGGLLVPDPVAFVVSGLLTDGDGAFDASVFGAAGAPVHVYVQALAKPGAAWEFSNGLDVVIGG